MKTTACPLAALGEEADHFLRLYDKSQEKEFDAGKAGDTIAQAGFNLDERDAYHALQAAQERAPYLVPSSPRGALYLLSVLGGLAEEVRSDRMNDEDAEKTGRKMLSGLYALRRFVEASTGEHGPERIMEWGLQSNLDPHRLRDPSSARTPRVVEAPLEVGHDHFHSQAPLPVYYLDALDHVRALLDGLDMAIQALGHGFEAQALGTLCHKVRDEVLDLRERAGEPQLEPADDAELLALGRALEEAWAAERAAFTAMPAGLSSCSDDPAYHAANERCSALSDMIAKTPARTMAGLRVKARAVMWCHSAADWSEVHDETTNADRLMLGIGRDLGLCEPNSEGGACAAAA